MIQIQETIVSKALLEEYFVCDLASCKGACCVKGDSGAPLEFEEIEEIEAELENILPFIPQKGKKGISRSGVFYVDVDGDYVTTLNEGKECAFTIFDQRGIAKCGMEEAFNSGKSKFRKPMSCHLFPVRVSKFKEFDALNYESIPICKPACDCGSKLKVKVYQFLKEPLIKKYGSEWYSELVEVDKLLQKAIPS